MKRLFDKFNAIFCRWYYLISFAITVLTMVALIAGTYRIQRTVYNIPEGVCYCPSCGTVMVLEEKRSNE